MDQNQTVDKDDLQKAIDDITNTTNTDPVFSDPVAAPSSVPEGDTGELSEPIGPFPEEKAKVEMVAPAPEPIAPLESVANIPELEMPPLESAPAPAPAPTPDSIIPPAPTPEPTEEEMLPEMSPELTTEVPLPDLAPAGVSGQSNVRQIRSAALRDLAPLLDRVNMPPVQKFNICCEIFEESKDYAALESAYKAAREIPDEKERADALVYIVESTNN